MPTPTDTSAPFGERTLAAVMFTDVVNFSGLMGAHEDRTLAAVKRDFKVMAALISKSSGQLIKTMGDGLLAYFGSAVNAVNCAQDIQASVRAASAAPDPGLCLLHRIGIHLGDVFISENDVLGNGVNIAARLQTRADPGGICISQTVFDVVKSKLTLQVNYLGPQELKHIRDAVPAYLVLPRKDAPAYAAPRVEITDKPAPPPRPAPKMVGLDLGQTPTPAGSPPHRPTASTTVLAIMGDFSGRASRGIVEPLATRRALPVDIDNFDEIFAKLAVRISLPAYNRAGATTEVALGEFEHFHPDELLRRIAPLQELWTLRGELARPATAASAADKLRAWLTPAAAAADAPPAAGPARHVESDTETLARLLARPAGEAAPARPAKPANSLEGIVQNLVRASTGHPSATRNVSAERSALDLELASQLRAVLHHPDFQAVEATWRGLKLFVRDFGAAETLKLFLIDVSKAEIAADPAGLGALLRKVNAGAVVADLFFGADLDDVTLLAQLARAATSTGSRLLAGARPELAGCESFARTPDSDQWDIALAKDVGKAWQALRTSPAAAHVLLAAPRVLLRQPYGQWSDAIESFAFEELPPSLPHESYLWGNAAFACGHMLASEIERGRSAKQLFAGGELGGLPVHRFKQEDETTVKPCAEAWLTERDAGVLEKRGVTTVFSIKGRDAARVARMVSIASPQKGLALPNT